MITRTPFIVQKWRIQRNQRTFGNLQTTTLQHISLIQIKSNEQVSLKDEGSLRFKTAILKRQDVQQRFQEMLQSLNAVKAEITQQSYVNDLKLRELTKKLEDHEKIVMKMKELESAASRCRLQLEESNKNLQFAMAQCSIDETEMLPEVTIEMKIEGPSTTSFVEVDEVHSDHKKRLLSLLISSIITNPGATTTREPDSHTESELSVTDETVYPIQNYLYSCEDTTFWIFKQIIIQVDV